MDAGTAAVLAGAITGGVSYLGIREQTRRLIEGQRESERRLRRGAYLELMVLLVRQTDFAIARPPSDEEYRLHFTEFQFALQAVQLYGSDPVRAKLERIQELNREIAAEIGTPTRGQSLADQWRPLYLERADALNQARIALLHAMRKDTAG